MKIEYPKWMYHATEPARIVDGYEAHEALGDGWAESPALLAAPSADVETEPARIVDGYEAHEALGDGWAESPALLAAPSADVETPAEAKPGKKRK